MNLFEKYGDFDFWHNTIYELYLDMGDHPEISYHFIGVDLLWLSRQQAKFLVTQIGGPKLYNGPSLKVVHERMGITPFQLNEILTAFADIFKKSGISEDDVKTIMQVIGAYESEIVTRQNSLWDDIMRPLYRWSAIILPKRFQKFNSWVRSGKLFK